MWRERGSETEREKVRVEAEVEEMQQKKMLSEEEKRRCVQLIVNMVFKSPYQGRQILLNSFISQVSGKVGEGNQHSAGFQGDNL